MLTAKMLIEQLGDSMEYSYTGKSGAVIYQVRYMEKAGVSDCEDKETLYITVTGEYVPNGKDRNVLSVPERSAVTVLKLLQAAVEKDYRMNTALVEFADMTARGEQIQELAVQIWQIMGGSVWILNPYGHLNADFGPVGKEAVKDVKEQIKNLCFPENAVVLEPTGVCSYRRYIQPVYHNSRLTGYVCVADTQENPGEKILRMYLDKICRWLSVRTSLDNYHAHTSKEHEFLLKLLEGKFEKEEEAEKEAENLHWPKVGEVYYILSVEMDEQAFLERMKRDLELLTGEPLFKYRSYFVSLFHCPLKQNLYGDIRGKLEFYLKENHLYAGLSQGFLKLTEMPEGFEQSVVCVKLRRRLWQDTHFARYDDLVLQHFMLIAEQNGRDLARFCNPTIRLIEAYDRENDTEYLRVLVVYLFLKREMQKSADALHIHRNTLKNRLNFLKEYFHVDFTSYRMEEHFRISLQILSLLGKVEIQDLLGDVE